MTFVTRLRTFSLGKTVADAIANDSFLRSGCARTFRLLDRPRLASIFLQFSNHDETKEWNQFGLALRLISSMLIIFLMDLGAIITAIP